MSNQPYDGSGDHHPLPLPEPRPYTPPALRPYNREERDVMNAQDELESASYWLATAARNLHDKDQRRLRKYRDALARSRKLRHADRHAKRNSVALLRSALLHTSNSEDAGYEAATLRTAAYSALGYLEETP